MTAVREVLFNKPITKPEDLGNENQGSTKPQRHCNDKLGGVAAPITVVYRFGGWLMKNNTVVYAIRRQ